jgi:aspartyl-tRNA(Asn)/glutamyl-tRNA(Gln) amidotransferase subunit A
LDYKGYNAYRKSLEDGSTTVVEQVEVYLKRIEENSNLNCFLEVYSGDARARATVIDHKIERGNAGKLAGMIIAIKDNLCYVNHKVSAGSKILENFQSLFSSTAVQRLLDEDAIIIGRTNCDEFAMGSANEFSAYGPVRNPHNENRVPGGSSGGSAAAVAANLCHVALGTDTGGSIRQPAAFTGTWGLKPTYGRVSRHGLIAYASSFDQIGPFAQNAIDTALTLEVISGGDEFDGTCSDKEVASFQDEYLDYDRSQPKRFAVFNSVIDHPGLQKEVKETFTSLIDSLKEKGHTVDLVEFPFLDELVPIYYLLTTAEASSNLARFDGVHYGYRAENAEELEEVHKKSRTEGFGKEVKRRILLGTFVLSAGYYDAYYGKAQKARRMVKEYTEKLLSQYDFILSPTSPHEAFPLGIENSDPTVMYLEDIFTVLANITGIPAISVPFGKGKSGLPLGIQLSSSAWSEGSLIGMAEQLGELEPVQKV